MLGVSNKNINFVHGGRCFSRHIRRRRGFDRLVSVAFVFAALLLGILVNPPVEKHEKVSAVTGTATPSDTEITLTNAESNASVNITTLDTVGSFATSSDENSAAFTLTTNNYTGYVLSMVADDDEGYLTAAASDDTLASIGSITNTSDFSANTQEAAAAYNGKWGIKPTKYMNGDTVVVNNSEDPVFLPSPTTTPTQLDKTLEANETGVENEYKIALGVRANYTTHSGTYTRTFQLVALANPVVYSVTFNSNTTDTVSNMPANISSAASADTTVDLPNTVPARSNYVFLGWCSVQPTVSGGADVCSGTVYNPNGAGTNLTYGLDQTAANDAILYAMWKERAVVNLVLTNGASSINVDGANYVDGDMAVFDDGSIHTISGGYENGYRFWSWEGTGGVTVNNNTAETTITVTGAGTLTLKSLPVLAIQELEATNCVTAAATPVYDIRDNTIYHVQRLADDKCWLLDNLALDLSTMSTLNSSDTNIINDWTIPAGITTWVNDSYTDPKINAESKDVEQSYGSGNGKVGVYYNYCAATAGTYCMASGDGSGDASQDICPKGWRMPTGGSSGEYQALYTAYSNNAANFKNALHAPLAGQYDNHSSALDQGRFGSFWSSTYSSAPYMYRLSTGVSGASTQNTALRSLGYSVRCVLDESLTINKIQSMQELASLSGDDRATVLASMAEGQAYPLKDSRDNTVYNVGKLKDDRIWLLDNLALDLTDSTVKANLSSANTNASDTSLTRLKNGGGTASDQYAMRGVSSTWSTSEYYESMPRVNPNSKDSVTSYGDGHGKAGVYYNYCAASAGSYCYGDATTGTGTPSGNALEDICPKGWRLPTGGSSGEYATLVTSYSSNVPNARNALRAAFIGYTPASSGISENQGNVVYYWSSSKANGNNSMYGLYFAAQGNAISQSGYYRQNGLSVRCVLDNPAFLENVDYLQDFASLSAADRNETISSMVLETAYQVEDSRDGTKYNIAKLADGNVWLLDNLALDLSTAGTLTPSDTNITSNWTAPAEITTWANSYTDPKINAESKDVEQSYGSGNGKVGVYYNYCAATAGTYCIAEGSGSGNATQDICPKGWRMPTGDSSGEYQALYTAYSSNATNFKNALRTPLSGYFYDGSASSQGSYGYFWSSTYSSAKNMYRLRVYTTDVYPQSNDDRRTGFAVRCVLNNL